MLPKLLYGTIYALLAILLFHSCKKDDSCENCNEANKPPVARAGMDEMLTLPLDSVLLDGSASSDSDGNITTYKWTQILGPNVSNTPTPDSSKTMAGDLEEGVYLFELTVRDNGGLSAKDTVQVTVKSPCDASNGPFVNVTLTEIGKLSEPRVPAVGAAGSKVVFAGGAREFFCGMDVFLSSSAIDIYDINTHVWTTAKLSKERMNISVASSGNKIFFAGGENWEERVSGMWTRPYTNIDIYDASTNAWSVAHLSQARTGMNVAVVGNKVIFAGGYFYTGNDLPDMVWDISDQVDIYDLSTNQWTVAKLSAPRYLMSTVVVGDKVYFAGGNNSTGINLNVVDVYNSSTNSWTTSNLSGDIALKNSTQFSNYLVWSHENPVQIKNLNNGTTTSNCVSGDAFNTTGLGNNEIIFFTGFNSDNGALTQLSFYNTVSGNWSDGKLNQAFPGTASAGVISFNNKTYIAGGVSGNDGCNYTYYDKVYVLNR